MKQVSLVLLASSTLVFAYRRPPLTLRPATNPVDILEESWAYPEVYTEELALWDSEVDCDLDDIEGCEDAQDCSAYGNSNGEYPIVDVSTPYIERTLVQPADIGCFSVSNPGDTVYLDYLTFADWDLEQVRPAGSSTVWSPPSDWDACTFDVISTFKMELNYCWEVQPELYACVSKPVEFLHYLPATQTTSWEPRMQRRGPSYSSGQWISNECRVEGYTGTVPDKIEVIVKKFRGESYTQVENTSSSQSVEFRFTNRSHTIKLRVP